MSFLDKFRGKNSAKAQDNKSTAGCTFSLQEEDVLMHLDKRWDQYSFTALCRCILEGDIEGVKDLLARGADVNASPPSSGATVLMLASYKGYTEIVNALLAKGANVNAKCRDGTTALKFASSKGFSKIVDLLKQAGAKE